MGHPSLSRTRDPPPRLARSAIRMLRPSPTGPQGLSAARPEGTLTTGGTWTVNERQHLCSRPVFMGAPHELQEATCYHGLPKWGTKLGSSTLVRATSEIPQEGQDKQQPLNQRLGKNLPAAGPWLHRPHLPPWGSSQPRPLPTVGTQEGTASFLIGSQQRRKLQGRARCLQCLRVGNCSECSPADNGGRHLRGAEAAYGAQPGGGVPRGPHQVLPSLARTVHKRLG